MTASSTALGVALVPDAPAAALAQLAATAEAIGYDSVWVTDDRLGRDPFTVLAAIAASTRSVRIGPGVANPYSRHPGLIATAVGTLDELSGGRAALGLGAGGTNHAALGVERRAPATAMAETVPYLRTLFAGGTADADGVAFSSHQATLGFPVRADLPIYIGSRGPRMLELAGALADGVIVGNVAHPDGWRYALECIGRGADGADRERPRLVAWAACAIDADEQRALDAVRPLVATSLATSRPILDRLGVALPPEFAATMESQRWSLSDEAVGRAAGTVPPDLARRFAIAGTPAQCREQIEELLGRVPEIDELTIIPFPTSLPVADLLRKLARAMSRETVHA